MPLVSETEEVKKPLVESGFDLEDVMYFGESVLRSDYRGQGIGVKFFELREAFALELGFKVCVFCAVIREENHPKRPKDFVSLEKFWQKRGYDKIPNCVAKFKWLDCGENEESVKHLQSWQKSISNVN